MFPGIFETNDLVKWEFLQQRVYESLACILVDIVSGPKKVAIGQKYITTQLEMTRYIINWFFMVLSVGIRLMNN